MKKSNTPFLDPMALHQISCNFSIPIAEFKKYIGVIFVNMC